MRRLPAIAFGAIAAATIFAFFLIQAIKTGPPLVFFNPVPIPAAFNPLHGRVCTDRFGRPLDYRRTTLSVVPSQAQTVAVQVLNASGTVVKTVSSGRPLAANQAGLFVWHGRLSDGRIAADGDYYFRVTLVSQDTTVPITTPITIMTHAPRPRVTSVTLTGSGATHPGATVTLTPPAQTVTVHFADAQPGFSPADFRRVWIDVYRTDLPGRPRLVDSFRVADPSLGSVVWRGNTSAGGPAPAGTYLIGITAQDMACNQAHFPARLPPAPGTTPGTGVDVRYVSGTAPLVPTVAGARAAVAVSSPAGRFSWRLTAVGSRRPLRQGSGPRGTSTLRVRLPGPGAGLYSLTLTAAGHSASVPLVGSAPAGPHRPARVLVLAPMLSWVGDAPADQTGDGLPSTLSAGYAVPLTRQLAQGLPRSALDDAALLAFLRRSHMTFQLTTDVALAEGVGPSLAGRTGVILPGGGSWLPAALTPILQGFVRHGGRVLSLGTGALLGSAQLSGYPRDPVAARPLSAARDPFGALHGGLLTLGSQQLTVLGDQLSLLRTVPALTGFDRFQQLTPPAGSRTSLIGRAGGPAAVAAFSFGKGYVAEIALARFSQSLRSDGAARALLTAVWALLRS